MYNINMKLVFMEKNLIKMEDFFNRNLKIKDLLFNLAPTREDGSNNYTIVEYKDKFENILEKIEFHIFKILNSFEPNEEVKKIIQKNFERYRAKIAGRIQGFEDLNRIYQDCCSDMNEDLVNKAREEFVGYLLHDGKVKKVMAGCQTINEMLHVIHSSIVNNENYYESMPKLAEKDNNAGYTIILCGREDELSLKLFNDFPLELNCGWTHIMSLKDNILMMVGDRGHALSITIEMDVDNTIWVKYFIPKICNVEMVNALKGVTKVDKTSAFTTGQFVTTKENLSEDIINFINGIPMDQDMVFDWIDGSQLQNEQSTIRKY